MGYNTDFEGSFKLSQPLTLSQKKYLEMFSYSRRMKRNSEIAEKLPDPFRIAVGLPIGQEGEFFVGIDEENFGQNKDDSIVEYNTPPITQPDWSLWCQWAPNKDGTEIEWNGMEKFYAYIEWIEYMIKNFFIPWGITLNGEVDWQGEEFQDVGTIIVKDNKVEIKHYRYEKVECEEEGIW